MCRVDRALDEALGSPDRDVAGAVRAAVVDLAVALHRIVLEYMPESTGAAADLHRELTALLLPSAARSRPSLPSRPAVVPVLASVPDPVPPPPVTPEDLLGTLAAEVAAAHAWWLGTVRPPASAAGRWEWLLLQSWRLPAGDERDLVARLRPIAEALGVSVDSDENSDLAADASVLVPPCPALGYAGLWADRTVSVDGSPEVARAAALLETLLGVASRYPALQVVFRTDNAEARVGSDEVSRKHGGFVADLARIAPSPLVAMLRIHHGAAALLPWPLPADDSRWARTVRATAEAAAAVASGVGVRLTSVDDIVPLRVAPHLVRLIGPPEQPEPRTWQLRLGHPPEVHDEGSDGVPAVLTVHPVGGQV